MILAGQAASSEERGETEPTAELQESLLAHRVRLGIVDREMPRLLQMLKHNGPVRSVRLSPDGQSILSASDDGTARVWDWENGTLVTAPLSHQGAVWFADFSPDGSRVVTIAADHTIRGWSVRSGMPITPSLPIDERCDRAEFLDAGQRLQVCAAGTVLHQWDLRPDDRPWAELNRWAELLAGGHVDDRGFIPFEPNELYQRWKKHATLSPHR